MARAQLFHDASASASSPCSLQDLRFTITELLTPLQKLLTATAHNAVFANLQQIAELHARLEDELQEAKRVPKKEKGEKIASAFIALLPFFKMYATYCANYGDVAHALEQVRLERNANVTYM